MTLDLDWLKALTFAQVEFRFRATDAIKLPEYTGSTFHGAFGKAFRRTVCVEEALECQKCILQHHCAYYQVFKTPSSGRIRDFSTQYSPHPYVLEPPAEQRQLSRKDETFEVRVILVGGAIDLLDYFIFVFEQIGSEEGLGKYRKFGFGRYSLESVREFAPTKQLLYDGGSQRKVGCPRVQSGATFFSSNGDNKSVTLDFLTPARINNSGEYVGFGKTTREFPADVFVENLHRRLFLLTHEHCIQESSQLQKIKVEDLHTVAADLTWQDWERYSSTQNNKVPQGGFTGSAIISGNIQFWLPLLRAGEVLHVGNASAFGLGKFVLRGQQG